MKIFGIIAAFIIGSTAGFTFFGAEEGQKSKQILNENPSASDFLSMRPQIESMDTQSLSAQEREGLVFMREEEKLARDVYIALYDVWGLNIFSNISQSEQTHTESVRALLVKYNIEDPVVDDAVGVFTNKDLAQLYVALVEQGKGSVEEALKVGALIEDLDIKDLQEWISDTDNDDIKLVYENLMRGSRNHLRSFVSQIKSRGETYVPEYITIEEFETILESSRETGGGQGSGGGRGWGRK